MKNTWKNDLKREYFSKKISNVYSNEQKRTMKLNRTALIPVCIVLASLFVISVSAAPIIAKWLNASLIKDNNTHIKEVPDGYIGIYTAEDLNAVRDNFDTNYILMNDIDLDGIEWEPIGLIEVEETIAMSESEWKATGSSRTYEEYINSIGTRASYKQFSNIFNGNGYVIRNMKVETDSASGGLFAKTSGTFICLGIEDSEITVIAKNSQSSYDNSCYVGAIAGSASFVGACYTENVRINVTVEDGSDIQNLCVGSLCGDVSYVDSCYVNADVAVNAPGNVNAYVGKLAGTTLSVVTSYSLGNAVYNSSTDNVYNIAFVSTGVNLPLVVEKDVMETIKQKLTDTYGKKSFDYNKFSAYFVLKDPSAEYDNDNDRKKVEDLIKSVNALKNFYTDNDEIRPLYILDPRVTIQERENVAKILLNIFGSEENLESFYLENDVRAGMLCSYALGENDVMSEETLIGFDFENIWTVKNGKAVQKVFG